MRAFVLLAVMLAAMMPYCEATVVKSLLHSLQKTVRSSMSAKKTTSRDKLIRSIVDGENLSMLKGLLDDFSDGNTLPTVKGWSSLHVAGFAGGEDAIRLLLDRGADPHAKDDMNMTALHLAQLAGKERNVELLKEALDTNSRAEAERDTDRLLQQAVIGGYVDDVKNLVELGHADVHARTDTQGWTALHLAAYQGNLKLVEYLLQAGARVDEHDQKGLRPLHLAMLGGYIPVVNALRREDGQEQAGQAEKDKEVRTLFRETVKLAVDAARAARESGSGSSGSSQGMRSMANLIGAGIDSNAADESTGSTAAHVCARHNAKEILRFLVENGAEASLLVQDKAGHTPLSVAQMHGSADVVEYLSERLGLNEEDLDEEEEKGQVKGKSSIKKSKKSKKSKGKSRASGVDRDDRVALSKER